MRLRQRMRLAPPRPAITLDDVLAGDTCAPVGLADFEAYLQHKEHSVENLRFVVWYQSYRRRFLALPAAQQQRSPGSREFRFALPSPARTAQHVSRVSSRGTATDEPMSPASSVHPPVTPTSYTAPLLAQTASRPCSTLAFAPSRPGTAAPPETQPFRQECALVVSTFFLPSAPYELMLPSLLHSIILRDLAANTHPDVFLPAYEFAYDALLTQSLPRFLDSMHENMNWEKKLYWWLYGILTSAIGWAIVIGCLFIEYGPHMTQGRLRAWRLLGVPFISLGAMQMYAAYRGFCSQIWGRGTMQLRPWELAYPPPSTDTVDTLPPSDKRSRRASGSTTASLRKAHIELVETHDAPQPPPPQESSPFRDPAAPPRGLAPIVTDGYRDVWDAAPPPRAPSPPPAAEPHGLRHYASRFSVLSKKSRHDAPYAVARAATPVPATTTTPATAVASAPERSPAEPEPMLSARARVFGPERVVLDPRIRAVHRRVMRDILVAGFVCGTVLTVVVVALPHAR